MYREMNKKIKVMKPSPLSDDEIRSYMNFEGLLQKQKAIITHNRYQLLKWGMGLVGAVALTIVMINLAPLTGDHATLDAPGNAKQDMQPTEAPTARQNDERFLPADSTPVTRRPAEPVERQHTAKNEISAAPAKGDAYVTAQQMEDVYMQAEPSVGYDALYQYFNENLVYPREAVKDSIQGVVTVSFTISSRGTVEDVTVKNSLGEPFERETLKLIGDMPPWKPATLNGSPVPSKISIPVTFSLQNVKP
jgi:TonB family protein